MCGAATVMVRGSSRPSVGFLTGRASPYQSAFYEALAREQGIRVSVLFGHAWHAPELRGVGVVAGAGRVLARLVRGPLDAAVLSNYGDPLTQIAAEILSRRRVPRLYWLERPGIRRRGLLGARIRAWLQRPLRDAAGIAAVGERARLAYRSICGPAIPVRSIPYGGDLEPFRSCAHRVSPVPRVLFVGGLSRRKGVDLLLRAFVEVSARVPGARLRLVGEGPLAGPARTLAASLPGAVEILGRVAWRSLPEQHASSQCFILPSRHDGWGVALEEAMAAGRAVVATRAVGAAELLLDGLSGLVAPPEAPDALASAMVSVLRDRERRRRLGAGARAAVGDRGAGATAARWAAFLREVDLA